MAVVCFKFLNLNDVVAHINDDSNTLKYRNCYSGLDEYCVKSMMGYDGTGGPPDSITLTTNRSKEILLGFLSSI
jgi:hypothetical protein